MGLWGKARRHCRSWGCGQGTGATRPSPASAQIRAGEPVEPAVLAINRGLVALNFRREPVYIDARTLESALRYRHYAIAQRKVPDLARVRQAFAGRAIHTGHAAWLRQLDAVMGR